MIESGNLDCSVDCMRVCRTEQRDQTIASILSPRTALNLLSQALTKGTTFEIESMELIYAKEPSQGEDALLQDILSHRHVPVWKVVLKTESDLSRYDYYIHAATGEIQAIQEHR